MTDKELLEFAAKAAVIDLADRHEVWNPLTDDGDALRLQVKLRIKAYYTDNAPPELGMPRECAVSITTTGQWFAVAVNLVDVPDECAALRLAVLRAAAEIGKSMP